LLESEGDSTSQIDELLDRWTLDDPVSALHMVSRDVTLAKPLALANGGFVDALTIQRALLDAARQARRDADRPGCAEDRVLNLWDQVLEDLAAVRSGDNEARLAMHDQAGRLEWLLKWQLLERLRRRRSIPDWSDPRLAALDLAWARVDPGRDLPWRLRGSVLRLVDSDQITRAM
ncbi:MAG: proteasome accessory factor PafA2 family protein, partial [Bifidobacterium sp.]|nr:proteasome accessory factor PafA2 family protein [Bifidobacterium sp.]